MGEERTAYGECVGLVLFFLSAIVAVASSGKVGKSARERVAGSKMQLGLKMCVKTLVQVLLSREGGHKRGGAPRPGQARANQRAPFRSLLLCTHDEHFDDQRGTNLSWQLVGTTL